MKLKKLFLTVLCLSVCTVTMGQKTPQKGHGLNGSHVFSQPSGKIDTPKERKPMGNPSSRNGSHGSKATTMAKSEGDMIYICDFSNASSFSMGFVEAGDVIDGTLAGSV